MTEQNQSPPPRTVASITKNPDAEPPSHPCDDPSLDARGFLLAVMHDRTFPLSVRMKAAEGALPYFAPRPNESRHYDCVPYHCRIVIEGIPSDHHCAERRASSSEHPPENRGDEPDRI